MSRKYDNLLEGLFGDRSGGNVHWREIESLLHHLGASFENLSGTRIRVLLNGVEGILHRPHHGHTLGRQELDHVREYLARAGVTPSQQGSGIHGNG